MHRHKKIMIIPCLTGMISTFLPWITVPLLGTFAGSEDKTGWITFALFGTALGICFGGNQKESLYGKFSVGIMAATGLAGFIGTVEILDYKNVFSFDPTEDSFGDVIAQHYDIGIGLYLAALSGIAGLVLAIFFNVRKEE